LQRLKRRVLCHRHVGPRGLPSAASSRGWARSTSTRAPTSTERNGLDGVQFAPGEQPKTQTHRSPAYPLRTLRTSEESRRSAAVGEMELMPSSCSFLSCNRNASSSSVLCKFISHLIPPSLITEFCLAIHAGLVPPSMTALADPKRKGRRGTVW
jgi:hypothetical protein